MGEEFYILKYHKGSEEGVVFIDSITYEDEEFSPADFAPPGWVYDSTIPLFGGIEITLLPFEDFLVKR